MLLLFSTRYPDEQSSGEIELEPMKSYYVEAIMVKRGDGSDNLSVGARFPSGRMARPLPASFITQTRLNTVSKKHELPRAKFRSEKGTGFDTENEEIALAFRYYRRYK